MSTRPSQTTGAAAISWISHVREVRHAISESTPICIRHLHIEQGPIPPQPTVPYPERHPFCELNIILEGRSKQHVGNQQTQRSPGDLMLLGPNTPHYAYLQEYPHRTTTVYFLPTVLFDLGPRRDGAATMARLTASDDIKDRVVSLPIDLQQGIIARLEEMTREFDSPQYGSEMRIRACLSEILTRFVRWEAVQGSTLHTGHAQKDWGHIENALRYLHKNYTDRVYVKDVAAFCGISSNRLQTLFRSFLGMSCTQYLMQYRISQAVAKLAETDARVLDVALSVGFNTLSHFNASFRRLMGIAPGEYARLPDLPGAKPFEAIQDDEKPK